MMRTNLQPGVDAGIDDRYDEASNQDQRPTSGSRHLGSPPGYAGADFRTAMNQMPAKIESYISATDEIVAEAAAGRMVILVDDENRENEGDLVIPAQFATAEVVNFMARHARGLICLALTPQRVQELQLPMMARSNRSKFETAFTASIEAATGVTTGISATDRARTIAVAINPESTPADIAMPGHVFPLRAREGGTLVRAGHTEAAVDLARCAGLNPAGVICEIMNEDGSMARLAELMAFSQNHGIKIGTIADLIAYRSRRERLVEQVALSGLHHPAFGEWRLHVFRDFLEGGEHLVLAKGDFLQDRSPALVKLHLVEVLADLIVRSGSDPLASAMNEITREGRGVVVLLSDGRRDAISSMVTNRGPHWRSDPCRRDYGIGAQILAELGIEDAVVLTSDKQTIVGFEGYGIRVSAERVPEPV